MIKHIKKKPKHFAALILVAIALTLGLLKDNWGFDSYSKLPPPTPSFDENYAMEIILKYESFGPKVPGNQAHLQAGDWIVSELKKLNLTVHEQKASAVTFDRMTIPIRNIIAQWNPKASKRYLLSAHWDNRPFADNDPKNKEKPVPGVNDGGSGVAVLFGIAKVVSALRIDSTVGIDFAFWDAEDWGTPSIPESYCLGSQYWAEHRIPENYNAVFGINFDMVGRSGSVFPIDTYSQRVAPHVIQGIREAAKKIGVIDLFPDYQIGPIVDDHYFISEKAKIPYVDIIYMTPAGRFAPEWHTIQDTSEFISRDILKSVGQTTIEFLWSY